LGTGCGTPSAGAGDEDSSSSGSDESSDASSTGADTTDDGGADLPGDEDLWPNVARVPVPETFTPEPDGSYSLGTGRELLDVGKAFYEEHPDAYDMLIVWTDFDVKDIFAFAIPLDHDIQGIGLQEVMQLYGWNDLAPASAGSAGMLEHVALMNSPATYEGLGFYTAQDIVTHEVGHRWSAYLSLASAADPWALTDAFYSHWNVYANMGGPSALGYGQLLDQGGGQFDYELVVPLRYSDVELYQQGLIPPEDVGETFYVTDATGFDPPMNGGQAWTPDSYGSAVSYMATRVDFDIDEVIADHGPRVPAHADAQTEFRMAFVLVCEDIEACDQDALDWVDEQRVDWETTFADATGGRASVDTTLD
jgi:hypothetical protein